jgi:UPF0271 protein
MTIDINSDMGESFGRYQLGLDSEIIALISSANIACGFHAGDPGVMHKTVEMAVKHEVGIGAHPGYPDLAGFGRRNMTMSANELRDAIIYQIGALAGFTQILGTNIQHVKPHGALYNMAAENEGLSKTIVEALLQFDEDLILLGLSGSILLNVARDSGLKAAREAFADRAYNEDGSLVSRNLPGAVLTDPSEVADRVLKMTKERKVIAITGAEIDLEVDTICVHGDTPGAIEHVKRITEALTQEGIDIAPVGSFLP